MSLTVTEASAVNTLLNWLLQEHDNPHPPSWEQACDAAALLADHAGKTLHAGWTGDRVRDAWQHLEFPGAYDDEDWPVDEFPLIHRLVADLLDMQDQGALDLTRWPNAAAIVESVKADMPRPVRDVQVAGGVL